MARTEKAVFNVFLNAGWFFVDDPLAGRFLRGEWGRDGGVF